MNCIFDVISSYTREEAINDRVLIDITNISAKMGFKVPVAITCNLNGIINDIPDICCGESYLGRLNDVLFMLFLKIKTMKNNSDMVIFNLILNREVTNDFDKVCFLSEITLKAIISPGDNLEPVITIMLMDED